MIVNAEARIAELEATNTEQAKELEWYHTLKIERDEGDNHDGGKKAQMLHEMWEENVRLKEAGQAFYDAMGHEIQDVQKHRPLLRAYQQMRKALGLVPEAEVEAETPQPKSKAALDS